MKTKIKASIFALILPLIICSLALEASAAKLKPIEVDIMETLKRQTYSDETLFERSFVLRDFRGV